jgi:membrane protein
MIKALGAIMDSDIDADNHTSQRSWGLAAAISLFVVAFLVGRLAPRGCAGIPELQRRRDALPADNDRGRLAASPSEIPPKGCSDILLRVYSNVGDHRILALAAGMTYYSLLAIFPALAALVAIDGLFSDPGTIARHLDEVSGFMPGGAIDVIRDQLTRVASKGDHTLSLTFISGLVISLWSANAAMKSLFDTLNIVCGEHEKRSFLKLNAISLAFTFAAITFVIATLGAIVGIPLALNYLSLSSFTAVALNVARWPAMFVVIALALACVYRFGPSRKSPRWRWITSGSIIATVLWLCASALFSWYAANFGKFNETYGELVPEI